MRPLASPLLLFIRELLMSARLCDSRHSYKTSLPAGQLCHRNRCGLQDHFTYNDMTYNQWACATLTLFGKMHSFTLSPWLRLLRPHCCFCTFGGHVLRAVKVAALLDVRVSGLGSPWEKSRDQKKTKKFSLFIQFDLNKCLCEQSFHLDCAAPAAEM